MRIRIFCFLLILMSKAVLADTASVEEVISSFTTDAKNKIGAKDRVLISTIKSIKGDETRYGSYLAEKFQLELAKKNVNLLDSQYLKMIEESKNTNSELKTRMLSSAKILGPTLLINIVYELKSKNVLKISLKLTSMESGSNLYISSQDIILNDTDKQIYDSLESNQ